MIDKLLKTTDEKELSQLAGNILRDGPFVHDEAGGAHGTTTTCSKCGLDMHEFGVPAPYQTEHYNLPCVFAVPIPITWDEAMKWFRKGVYVDGNVGHNFYFKHSCLLEVYMSLFETDKSSSFQEWLEFCAEPGHYIKASCMAKLYLTGEEEVSVKVSDLKKKKKWS